MLLYFYICNQCDFKITLQHIRNMSSKIRKRSGHQVPFDMDKIFKAVESAFESCGKKCPATFRSILNQNINRFKTAATVERIQDEI